MTTPHEAAVIAEGLLAPQLPRRWAHTQGVARKARELAHLAGPDADILEAAAWLHDIGYAQAIATTGFHPLDGAQYLRGNGLDARLVALVAHHSTAGFEAEERGLSKDLGSIDRECVNVHLHDLLTFCDMTTSPDGESVNLEDRLQDIYRRYEPDSVVHRSMKRAESALRDRLTKFIPAKRG